MMERVYAFIDEYGAFGWEIANPSVSTHFIITAIIVKESELEEYSQKAENLRKRFFQTGEIKSSGIGSKHARRQRILEATKDIPFRIFSVVVDKKRCLDNMTIQGLKYKKTFYKFMNNIVHKELRRAFEKVTIIADELIDNDYMQSFCRYVDEHQDPYTLFGVADFSYENSKSDARLQMADLFSGTLAYQYDEHKKSMNIPDFRTYYEEKVLRIEMYPKVFTDYSIEDCAMASEYDIDIAKICFASAVNYILKSEHAEDETSKAQILTIKHLLFRFMNNDRRGYFYTNEILGILDNAGIRMSETTFRTQVIGKLRDNNVILASSNKGYKIPSRKSELIDYVNHDARVIIPMLARLKKCRDLIKLGTTGACDLLNEPEYSTLKLFFDSVPEDSSQL